MKPLLFLASRTFINSIRRAFSSPKRLISLLMFVGYYWWIFMGRLGRSSATAPAMPAGGMHWTMPPVQVLNAIVFGLFSVASLFLAAGVMSYRGSFRPADVDVLFPTPVSPKTVLAFRLARDYLITLLLPLVLAVLGWRGTSVGVQSILTNFPKDGALVFRAFMLAWVLMSLAWVSIGYAMSLFVSRSDLKSDRNRLIIGATLTTVITLVAVYITVAVREDPRVETALALSNSGFLHAVFFTATAATIAVSAPLNPAGMDYLRFSLGLGSLVLISVVAIQVAMTQVEYLYDQAAARGFDSLNLRSLQRKGDTYGMVAERARQGKMRRGRLSTWIASWRVQGAGALVWKEALLQARGSISQYVIFGPLVLFMVLMPLYIGHGGDLDGYAVLFMSAFGVWIMSLGTAQGGFIEFLRRVDVQKPLPFTPTAVVFWEVAAKAVPSIVVISASSIGVILLRPGLAEYAGAAVLMMPTLACLLVSIVLLVTLLFPDVDDATQRGFRGLMMLIGIAISASPGVAAAMVLIGVLKVDPVLSALPVVLINLGVTFGVSLVAGMLYAAYNPSE